MNFNHFKYYYQDKYKQSIKSKNDEIEKLRNDLELSKNEINNLESVNNEKQVTENYIRKMFIIIIYK